MIVKRKGKWQLFSKDGSRLLGTFDTRAEAERAERRAIFFGSRRRRRRRSIARLILAASVLLVASGCTLGGLRRHEIVKHPDAPMLIAETRGRYARVFVYQKTEARLVEYGWVRMSKLEGWTLTKYDWEARIARDTNNGE
jgi:hypothetical protein